MGRHANTWENIERILEANTVVDEKTGCWLWQGEIGKSGYGRVRVEHKKWRVNRVAAWLYLGLDELGDDSNYLVLHKPECPNKHCWNPEHLYIGDGKDNWRDWRIVKRGRPILTIKNGVWTITYLKITRESE